MKNNKGYTLVEMLVSLALLAMIMAQIGNMLANTSIIYQNGTYEVGLQTEAQQVMQLMNELMIDVPTDGAITAISNPLVGSDVIVIDCAGVTYTIWLEKNDPADPFGELHYQRDGSVSGGTLGDDVLMAEYVNSISMNMTEYGTANIVVLSVSMNNGKYSYQAEQPIFLRNPVGTGQNLNYSSAGQCNYDIDVLRYRSYNLNKICTLNGETYTYEWDPADKTSAELAYNLAGSTLTPKSTTTNQQWNEVGPFMLLGHGSGGTDIKIRISSQKVEFGSEDKGIVFANTDSSYAMISAIPVHGIDITQADSITVTPSYMTNAATTITGSNLYPSGSVPEICYTIPSGTQYKFRTDGNFEFAANEAVNSFDVTSYRFMYDLSGGGYRQYILETNKPLFFDVEIKYGSQTLNGTLYYYAYALNWPDADEKFWQAVGWD